MRDERLVPYISGQGNAGAFAELAKLIGEQLKRHIVVDLVALFQKFARQRLEFTEMRKLDGSEC